ASARVDEAFPDAMIERRVSGRPWRYIRARSYWSAKDALDTYGAAVDSRPSSGVLVLFQIMNSPSLWRPITLFGFSHEGWEGHAWDAERALVVDWRGLGALPPRTGPLGLARPICIMFPGALGGSFCTRCSRAWMVPGQ